TGVDVNGTLGTPVPSTSFYTASSGTQTGRLTRNGVVSTCAAPKSSPGVSAATGARTFDAYAFNVCTNLGDTCVQVSLEPGANSLNFFTAAYLPSFDPANVQTNYAADAGVSSAAQAYSFKPGANSTVTVVVHEVNIGSVTGFPYHSRVSGLCSGSCTRNG